MDMRNAGTPLLDMSTVQTFNFTTNEIYKYQVWYFASLGNNNSQMLFDNGILATPKFVSANAHRVANEVYALDFSAMLDNAFGADPRAPRPGAELSKTMVDRQAVDLKYQQTMTQALININKRLDSLANSSVNMDDHKATRDLTQQLSSFPSDLGGDRQIGKRKAKTTAANKVATRGRGKQNDDDVEDAEEPNEEEAQA